MSEVKYIAPTKQYWQGRADGEDPLYWHQHVRLHNLATENISGADVVLLGYSSDAGAVRNQGRNGAAAGPDFIRQKLAPLAWHLNDSRVIDAGNYAVLHNIEELQMQASTTIAALVSNNKLVCCLGGSHDMSFASYCALQKAFPDKHIGIINFDAHFDLRQPMTVATSGTPFYQAWQLAIENNSLFRYAAIGIQQASNNYKLFETAKACGAQWLLADSCTENRLPEVSGWVEKFLQEVDIVHLSIDLDVFATAYAPGVSAPAPLGISPAFVMPLLEQIVQSGKLKLVDVAELNPQYDRDGQTAGLAARLLEKIIHALYQKIAGKP